MAANHYNLIVFTSTGSYTPVYFNSTIEQHTARKIINELDVQLLEEFELTTKLSYVAKDGVLYFTDSLDDDIAGEHTFLYELCTISINPYASDINEILAHEIVHAKQWARGDLSQRYFDDDASVSTWKGIPKQTYNYVFSEFGNLGYYLSPWEIEAYLAQYEYRLGDFDKALKGYSNRVLLEIVDNNILALFLNLAVTVLNLTAVIIVALLCVGTFSMVLNYLIALFIFIPLNLAVVAFFWFWLHRWGLSWYLKRRMNQ